jgi:hypothetical protein
MAALENCNEHVLVIQKNIRNNPGPNCNENIIATSLHPVIAARRLTQAMAAPVVYDILAATVFV